MNNRKFLTFDTLNQASFDYIPLAQSPAEVDMLRYLALYSLNPHYVMNNLSLPRLKNLEPWDFYNLIYERDYTQPFMITQQIAEEFSRLKFENELSLNNTESNLSPYHPMLNNLPPLILPNMIIRLQNLQCFNITEAQPYLNFNYKNFTTKKHLTHQIDELNNIYDRNTRLNNFVYVKRIKEHSYFDALNGQRGVFAKTDIPAGTIIEYYSGEYAQYPQPMPPMLCTWRVQKSENWLKNQWQHRKISRFSGWTDAFILGNMMKLVNSCSTATSTIPEIGNIGCYYFHFKSKDLYVSLPVYVAIKDISKNSELLTFYHVKKYQQHRIYGNHDLK